MQRTSLKHICLHMIAQHQLLRIGVQIHLLVYPLWHRSAAKGSTSDPDNVPQSGSERLDLSNQFQPSLPILNQTQTKPVGWECTFCDTMG
jgi:hypothetical protein